MCLTLSNAVDVLDMGQVEVVQVHDGRSPAPGYTRTRHHIGHLDPGDWWFPRPDPLPRTVTAVQRRAGRILLTDQYGSSYSHPSDAVVSTAVPDRRILTPTATTRRA